MSEGLMNFFNRFSIEQLILYGSGILLSLLLLAFCFAGFWGIMNKAGENGWKVLIPFYNLYMFVQLAEMKGILFLLLFVPVVNLVFAFICFQKIAARFEKGVGFAIGLFLLPGIFSLILGFGPAQCKNPKEVEDEPYYYYYKPKF